MRFLSFIAVLLLPALSLADAPSAPPLHVAPKVQLASIKVGNTEPRSFQILLQLRLQNIGGKILGPFAPLSVSRFVDDLGTPLLDPAIQADSENFPELIGRMTADPDRNAAVLEIASPNKPAPTAKKLILEGTAHLVIGHKITTTTWKNFRLRLGQQITTGGSTLTLKSLFDYSGMTRSYPEDTNMTFFGSAVDNIAAIRFFNADKKQIGHGENQGYTHAADYLKHPDGTFQCYVSHPGNEVTLEVDYCDVVEQLDLPVKIEIPLVDALPINDRFVAPYVEFAYRNRIERLARETRAATRPARPRIPPNQDPAEIQP